MSSASSSKSTLKNGSASADLENYPTTLDGMSIQITPLKSLNGLLKQALRSDWSETLRSIAGAASCAGVVTYVAGYTCGYWFHRARLKMVSLIRQQ